MTSPLKLAIPVLLVCVAARAEEAEQAAPGIHLHDAVTLNVALEGNRLSIEVEAPAINVAGFEHAPHTPEEHAAAEAARALFESGRGMFLLPGAAGCRTVRRDVSTPEWEASSEHDEEVGARDREHEHADYRGRYEIHCAQPEKLAWLEVPLLTRFLGEVTMTVNIVTPTLQIRRQLDGMQTRVSLQ